MTTIYDVPAKELIDAIAKKLQNDDAISIPEANIFSTTGVSKENPPTNKDWWYTRCASILRKIYVSNVIGIEHLRAEYGGKKIAVPNLTKQEALVALSLEEHFNNLKKVDM